MESSELYIITYGKMIWINNVKSAPASDRDTPIYVTIERTLSCVASISSAWNKRAKLVK